MHPKSTPDERTSACPPTLNPPRYQAAHQKLTSQVSFHPSGSNAQNLTTTMVRSVANDFAALEYSPTTAGAVFDTLALVSGNGALLRADSQVLKLDGW